MDDASDVGSAQRRIVDLLKRATSADPVTTGDIADVLGVTTQAVRPQLAELEERGLVVSETISTGVRGRPPVGWALTALAVDLFPDRHGDLTVELLRAVRNELGDDALDTVIAARDRQQLAEVNAQIAARGLGPDDVADRVEVLAAHRTRQGYMADVTRDGDDLLLTEHHCPVCAAATECQSLCRGELEMFAAAVGDGADVERQQHLLSGDARCVYRIRTRRTS